MHRIQTFNTLASRGLERFPADQFEIGPEIDNPDAILLHSHKLESTSLGGQFTRHRSRRRRGE